MSRQCPQASDWRLQIPPAARPPTILVVEDDPNIRGLLHDILVEEGFVVHTAIHGGHALTLARAVRPDLILTDLMMPVMDGYHLRTRLQHHVETSAIPVVLMSAAKHAAIGEAFTGFVAKPFNIDDVLHQIEQHLGNG